MNRSNGGSDPTGLAPGPPRLHRTFEAQRVREYPGFADQVMFVLLVLLILSVASELSNALVTSSIALVTSSNSKVWWHKSCWHF